MTAPTAVPFPEGSVETGVGKGIFWLVCPADVVDVTGNGVSTADVLVVAMPVED
tara:strand:- start:2182 stop:2343 length:162 start_codon:yes stop_codon:yes gene_type:complete